jgi:hypothetical protein
MSKCDARQIGLQAPVYMGDWLGGVYNGHGRPAVRCYLCGRGRSSEGREMGRQDGVVGQACPCLVVVQTRRIFM